MDASHRRAWLRTALLAGVGYTVIGRVFALPVDHVHLWRLAAWMASGVTYAAHIGYEHLRLRNSPPVTAWHAAVAVAIGAVGLALAGMLNAVSMGSGIRPAWLLALVAWPAITAVPAFLVAWAAAAMLPRGRDQV
jgi:hypothetical protein